MTCPNCGGRNPSDAAFCVRCGFRLPTAAARGAGVTYRKAQQAEPLGGGGQGVLAFGAVLLAGLLFAGGALALFLSAPPVPTPTPPLGADASPVSSLPIFIQPTPTPSPTPAPTPFPSGSPLDTPFASSSGLIVTPTPSFIVLPTPTAQTTPTPQPTPTRTPRPTPSITPTPPPTPSPTPFDCATAPGTNIKSAVIGYGNATSRGPLPRTWCVSKITISPWVGYGTTTLLRDGKQVVAFTCAPQSTCQPQVTQDVTVFVPPRRMKAGSTLTYVFECTDDPSTLENECTDAVEDGATIQIDYEAVDGP